MPSIWGPVVGFVGSQLVGFIWYSPYLFGPRWMKMVHPGKTWDQLKDSSTPAMLVALVSHAVLAGFLNHVYLDHWGVTDMVSTLRAGLAISGIGALSEVCHVMFAHKPLALFAIDSGFNTAVILAISAGIGYFV